SLAEKIDMNTSTSKALMLFTRGLTPNLQSQLATSETIRDLESFQDAVRRCVKLEISTTPRMVIPKRERPVTPESLHEPSKRSRDRDGKRGAGKNTDHKGAPSEGCKHHPYIKKGQKSFHLTEECFKNKILQKEDISE